MDKQERQQLAAPVIDALNRVQNGANVHTVNKARSYLEAYADGAWWIEDDEKNQRYFEAHLDHCKEALKSGNWLLLSALMRNWF